jgi:hypothetical protein
VQPHAALLVHPDGDDGIALLVGPLLHSDWHIKLQVACRRGRARQVGASCRKALRRRPKGAGRCAVRGQISSRCRAICSCRCQHHMLRRGVGAGAAASQRSSA